MSEAPENPNTVDSKSVQSSHDRVKTVYVVDDDEAVRTALNRSLGMRGYQVVLCNSAEHFLELFNRPVPCCLLLDVRMPGIGGLELQQHLTQEGIRVPIIFVTGHGDIPMSVRAMKEGAVDFLEKPYLVETLLERIETAMAHSHDWASDIEKLSQTAAYEEQITQRFEKLTPRQRDVFRLLVAGASDASNKSIARELDISHRTVDDHRAKIMSTMEAKSLPQLVEMAKICGIYTPEPLPKA